MHILVWKIRGDKDIVLAFVKIDGRLINYASEELRKDLDVILAAINQNGLALRYLLPEFTTDRKIVLVAVKRSCNKIFSWR